MKFIDLNADLGEGMPWDFELLARVTSANISCGAHAGDPVGIAATLLEAKRRGVVVGAHPGWPDRDGFGRIEQAATAAEVSALVIEQIETLRAIAQPIGVEIRYLKPHGALYNQAMRGEVSTMTGLLHAAQTLNLPLLGQPGTDLERKARNLFVGYVSEGFPDRRHGLGLRLMPRTSPNVLITDRNEAVQQACDLMARGIQSLCLHGDSAHAVEFADTLLAEFVRRGVVVRSFIDSF